MTLEVGKTYKTKNGIDVHIWDIMNPKYHVFGTYYISTLPGFETKQYGRWDLNGKHSSEEMFDLILPDESDEQPKLFGELTMDEKVKLFIAQQEGRTIEFLDTGERWLLWPTTGAFRKEYAYRVAKDLKPSTIDWDHVNSPYNYMATDKDYGTEPRKTMLFAEEPWYDDEAKEWKYYLGPNDVTPPISAEVFKSFVRGEQNGKFSLVARPGIILKNGT